ncbi:MAG: MFS transporter [Acidobacteria bacterium]|nr:MFS transporter [Acidobacteriota bacterium]
MNDFLNLLKRNRNYRYTWMGQIVSEIGDHFNNIAVFSLVMETSGSGLVVSGVMLSRAIPMVLAGPLAGVVLDRYDRKRIMIASDIVRTVIALGFIATTRYHKTWLLYLLSALLMVCSPFFTSGRTSILPTITSSEELHTANSLTQTTQWTTITIGTMAAGFSAAFLGLQWAFVLNAFSFLFSAWCISQLQTEGSFRAKRGALTESAVVRPWHEYKEGLRYMKSSPLILGIALVGVGWATGGGAAQILFTLFGDQVFKRGPAGIGVIWSFAGMGLLVGGAIGHYAGKRTTFEWYKRLVSIGFILHGGAYVIFSQMQYFGVALLFIALSRVGVAIASVLNISQMLRHVPDEFRGRVFSTAESLTWATMMVSMAMAGAASQYYGPRSIAFVAGILSSTTAIFWGWASFTGRLPEPEELGVDPKDVEIHGEPTV